VSQITKPDINITEISIYYCHVIRSAWFLDGTPIIDYWDNC